MNASIAIIWHFYTEIIRFMDPTISRRWCWTSWTWPRICTIPVFAVVWWPMCYFRPNIWPTNIFWRKAKYHHELVWSCCRPRWRDCFTVKYQWKLINFLDSDSLRKLGVSRIAEDDQEHWLYLARDGVNQRARDLKANRKRKFYVDEQQPVFKEDQIWCELIVLTS